MARTKGLQLVFSETYPNGTTDFSGILSKVKATKPDVLMAASIRLEDLVAITRQAKELDVWAVLDEMPDPAELSPIIRRREVDGVLQRKRTLR